MLKCKKLIKRNSWIHSAQGYHDAKVKHHVVETQLFEPSNNERKSFKVEDISSD